MASAPIKIVPWRFGLSRPNPQESRALGFLGRRSEVCRRTPRANFAAALAQAGTNLPFALKEPRQKSLLFLLRNESETENMPAELDLVLNILEKLSFAGTKYNAVDGKRMLHVFRSENKPTIFYFADKQVPRREICDLAEIGFRQSAICSDDVSIFARIARSLRADLQLRRKFGLTSSNQACRAFSAHFLIGG